MIALMILISVAWCLYAAAVVLDVAEKVRGRDGIDAGWLLRRVTWWCVASIVGILWWVRDKLRRLP